MPAGQPKAHRKRQAGAKANKKAKKKEVSARGSGCCESSREVGGEEGRRGEEG